MIRAKGKDIRHLRRGILVHAQFKECIVVSDGSITDLTDVPCEEASGTRAEGKRELRGLVLVRRDTISRDRFVSERQDLVRLLCLEEIGSREIRES